jgi:hypothetical protein
MGLEALIELDGMHVGAPGAQEIRQGPKAGTDLEDDVTRSELGEACNDAEDVVVGEEMLAE